VLSLVAVQRDTYIETQNEESLSAGNVRMSPPAMIHRHVSVASTQRQQSHNTDGGISSPPPSEDISRFGWYVRHCSCPVLFDPAFLNLPIFVNPPNNYMPVYM